MSTKGIFAEQTDPIWNKTHLERAADGLLGGGSPYLDDELALGNAPAGPLPSETYHPDMYSPQEVSSGMQAAARKDAELLGTKLLDVETAYGHAVDNYNYVAADTSYPVAEAVADYLYGLSEALLEEHVAPDDIARLVVEVEQYLLEQSKKPSSDSESPLISA